MTRLLVAVALGLPLFLAGCSVTKSGAPVPGGTDFGEHLNDRFKVIGRDLEKSAYTLDYVFLNTNGDLPPYDRFWVDTLPRDLATIHMTFDTFLFNYDWDDPYIE